ncbi:GntR family transcriptional regulator [Sulfurifustis variabilis]|uniref:GntR family transcriptional regulator n=1 Tax=Sulfurifustis variabilis TaxID=1675686 RepID=A0A1B4VCR0_9GAMM|nr:GntR family transcriptional regulator [Sulfurifustis variabilis]BAU46707.1 GntR family transcriptional regulator [Sulfurifustis variabilis]
MSETAPARPIHRTPLHDEVARRIRDLIVEGELAPGARVPERELCERFGISRTPLREALKILASEGLVDLQHHRGAVISQLTSESVDEMFQVMEALEALAGELACTHATDGDIAAISALHEQMLSHHARRDLSEYFKINQRIHEAIVNAAGNALLAQIYRSLNMRLRRARYMANLSPPRWDQAVAEHEHILAALAARDGARLARLLKEHLQHKADVVKAVLLGDR